MKKKKIESTSKFQKFCNNGLSKKESKKIKGGKTDGVIISDLDGM